MKNIEQIINHYNLTGEILWAEIEQLSESDQKTVLKTILKKCNVTAELLIDCIRLFVITEGLKISKQTINKLSEILKASQKAKEKNPQDKQSDCVNNDSDNKNDDDDDSNPPTPTPVSK